MRKQYSGSHSVRYVAEGTREAHLAIRQGRWLKVPQRSSASCEQARCTLARRLRARFSEIEVAVFTRIQEAIPVPANAEPEYKRGFREAGHEAIRFMVDSIETGEAKAPSIPLALLAQARLAARHDVSLGTVLRRYGIGAHQINDQIVTEATRDPRLLGDHLQQILREQALILGRVLLELEHEYGREEPHRLDSHSERLADLVKRRLAGELVDTSILDYPFDRHHLGVVTTSGDSETRLRDLAKSVDGRLLLVRPDSDRVWAWIGTRHRVHADQLCAGERLPADVRLSLGESGSGPLGWGQTHRQAQEAFQYALSEGSSVRYADIALRAAIEQNDLAAHSLRQIYVVPLETHAGGDVLIETLRAYFAADRKTASAQATLKVSRQTIWKRLHAAETILRKPLTACCPDLEIALRLHDLRDRS